MISKSKLILAEKEHWNALVDKVYTWCRSNVPDQLNYNSRATYWGSALRAGIINKEEYDLARTQYANLWDYVGD